MLLQVRLRPTATTPNRIFPFPDTRPRRTARTVSG